MEVKIASKGLDKLIHFIKMWLSLNQARLMMKYKNDFEDRYHGSIFKAVWRRCRSADLTEHCKKTEEITWCFQTAKDYWPHIE